MWLLRFKSWTTISRIANDTEAALKRLVPDAYVHWLEGIEYNNVEDIYKRLADHFNNKSPLWLLEQQLWDRAMSSPDSPEILNVIFTFHECVTSCINRRRKNDRFCKRASTHYLYPSYTILSTKLREQIKETRLTQKAKSRDIVPQLGDVQSILSAQTKCVEKRRNAVGALRVTKEAEVCSLKSDTIR